MITIALHTRAHSERLARLLEKEGMKVKVTESSLSSVYPDTVELKIEEEDFPAALRIIENIEIFPLEEEDNETQGQPRLRAKDILLGKKPQKKGRKPLIILPVDFSEYSLLAARVAFHIAKNHDAKIVLLHAFVLPSPTDNLSLSPDTIAYEPKDVELDLTLEETAKEQMKNFSKKLKELIKDGEIPPVTFSSEILEGLPETVINDYARGKDPLLIVMGTRGSDKKDRELLGSITAEVLDTCRFPVFTVPETRDHLFMPAEIHDVVFFCNLDGDDLVAMNHLFRIFPDSHFHITFIHIPTRRERLLPPGDISSVDSLVEYCKIKFKDYSFSSKKLPPEKVKELFTTDDLKGVHFIILPNKRRNALIRLFNPSLAHRLLFHADIPMMALPV